MKSFRPVQVLQYGCGKVSPGQKVLNRYVYTGGVFAAAAALTIAHYAW